MGKDKVDEDVFKEWSCGPVKKGRGENRVSKSQLYKEF